MCKLRQFLTKLIFTEIISSGIFDFFYSVGHILVWFAHFMLKDFPWELLYLCCLFSWYLLKRQCTRTLRAQQGRLYRGATNIEYIEYMQYIVHTSESYYTEGWVPLIQVLMKTIYYYIMCTVQCHRLFYRSVRTTMHNCSVHLFMWEIKYIYLCLKV